MEKYPPRWFVRATEKLRYFFFRMHRRFTHPRVVLWEHVHNMWVAAGIGLAAELGLADLLAKGPLPVDELARQSGSDRRSLYRVLRMLASQGIFREIRGEGFANTALSRPLMEGDVRHLFRAHLGPGHFELFSHLKESVMSGKPARGNDSGRELFHMIGSDETRNTRFNRAMSDASRMQVPAILPAFPFRRFRTIADIGGGQGNLLSAILKDCPGSRGILFDLPAVLEGEREAGRGPEAEERITRISGDFFREIPPGADLYMMKNILHDWEDSDSLLILQKIRQVMNGETRLLIIEAVLEEDNRPAFGKMTDVLMMVSAGGLERTRGQWMKLFHEAGFTLCRIYPIITHQSLMELKLS